MLITDKQWIIFKLHRQVSEEDMIEQMFERHCRRQKDINYAFDRQENEILAGLFKMSTGKDMGIENQKIEIDKETGEVVMRFKMKF